MKLNSLLTINLKQNESKVDAINRIMELMKLTLIIKCENECVKRIIVFTAGERRRNTEHQQPQKDLFHSVKAQCNERRSGVYASVLQSPVGAQ